MKKLFYVCFAVLLVVAGIRTATAQEHQSSYIVVLKDNVTDVPEDVAHGHGVGPTHVYSHALKGFAGNISDTRLAEIKQDPRVAFVSEDREISIDKRPTPAPTPSPTISPTLTPLPTISASPTPTPSPSATPAISQKIPTGIDRMNAEPTLPHNSTGAGIQVAVIDTGIDLSHPDLSGAVIGGKNCSTGSSYADGNGHGTHVAGTIAARNNTWGVVGVAPDVKLWAVRVLNNAGSGTWSSVICGIDFVTSKAPANGGSITVANMSLGGTGSSDNNCGNTNGDALHKAICRSRDAGVTYVVAAGNESDNAGNHVPAAYDDAVITVSALADSNGTAGGGGAATGYGADDTFATFSNYGPAVDIAAPGVNILSTWKGGTYNTISGTSMATPHVTGAAALYLATHPESSWTAVRDTLKSLGEPLDAGHSDPSGLHPEPVLRADTL